MGCDYPHPILYFCPRELIYDQTSPNKKCFSINAH